MRLLRERYEDEKNEESFTEACVEWAFAGRSSIKPQGARENGMVKLSHTVWDHWIDSKSDNPDPDEGDMWVRKDGDVLERGKQTHPVTGEETEYEELWHDLEVDAMGKKQNRNSLVLRADNPERDVRGMAVKVGGWCQAITKAGGALTVERWERKATDSTGDEAQPEASKAEERTRNGWVRTFRVGKGTLPCEYMCSHTSGKIGLNTTLSYQTDEEWTSATDWKVLEEYYW